MYWFLFIITWIFFRIVWPCKIIGKKNYRKTNGVVVSNHLSNVDVIYIAHYLYGNQKFLAKKELFNTKFKSWLFKSIGAIPVDREKLDISAIKESLLTLKNNKKLIIFPEGTRNKEGTELQELKNGSAMLAIRSKKPIIPMRIQERAKAFHRNKIIIGEPFELSEFYDVKLTADVIAKAGKIIEEKIKSLN